MQLDVSQESEDVGSFALRFPTRRRSEGTCSKPPGIFDDANQETSIAERGDEFVIYLRTLGDTNPTAFDPRTLRQDGFGTHPAFSGLVAELDGTVHGYLLYHPGYDLDRGGRVLYVADLYVHEEAHISRASGTR